MSIKFKRYISHFHLSINVKLCLAIFSIVAILLVSCVVSILHFRRMSTYVSDSISGSIEDINMSSALALEADEYNLQILSIVGEADSLQTVQINPEPIRLKGQTILSSFTKRHLPGADSLEVSFDRFIDTSLELQRVIASDFVDSREWYFTALQPYYNKFRMCQENFNAAIHDDLHENSMDFDDNFYRGIIPGVVSVLAGVLLCILLLFFLMTFYVRPLRRMLHAIDSYKCFNQSYKVTFEGDDEMQDLNGCISDVIDENIYLRKRLRDKK